MNCKVLAVLSCIGIVVCSKSETYKNRHHLRDDLMYKYEKDVMPDSIDGNAVNVSIGVDLLRIIDMDNQILTLDTVITEIWQADNLKWRPGHVGGLEEIRLPSDLIWKPDLALADGAGKTVFIKSEDTNVIINSSGFVSWYPPVKTKTFCSYGELQNGDEIECHLTLYSWTHSTSTLDLKLQADEMDTSNLDVDFNPHWKLVSTHADVKHKVYSCCPESYAQASFTFRLRYVA
ncbi:neuronal acetylcholine receptor subunit alpha-10-like [Mya arenaria]|uniref:neuronal acetylcholine receptor subunit alpha-10-like n=1 Tax=Mya arenaria TaxID=6604 RepID=UPI0022E7F95E|nr:neuronal acetylcholine receptor subunit alpha-10-like [Mya arenaria]